MMKNCVQYSLEKNDEIISPALKHRQQIVTCFLLNHT